MSITSVSSIKGRRDYMEDRYISYSKDDIKVVMLCDGHGGSISAEQTINNLPQMLTENIFDILKNTADVIQNNFEIGIRIRDTIISWGKSIKTNSSGATLTGIVVVNNIVFIYNIGDSRTVFPVDSSGYIYKLEPIFDKSILGEKVNLSYFQTNFFKTVDHEPSNMNEVNRITNAGGNIENTRLNGILAVTRAFGDNGIGNGLTYVPDVYWVKQSLILGPIVMYSDGVYEMYKNGEENADIELYNIAFNNGAEALVNYALQRQSGDNLTAIVVKL
jgi:serine/threonine protein phosphatase PrpC